MNRANDRRDAYPTGADIYHRRHLPHWQPQGGCFFVTFRERGSLTAEVLAEIRAERQRLISKHPGKNSRSLPSMHRRLFAIQDSVLDRLQTGSLATPTVAELVMSALLHFHRERYFLHRYVIMPNHVHLLLEPLPQSDGTVWPLGRLMHSVKSYSAKRINKVLSRSGPFWQDESYDHWVRDDREFARIWNYIDWNPVQAGLCQSPDEWRWSSAFVGRAASPVTDESTTTH